MLYDLMPTMHDDWLQPLVQPLVQRFSRKLQEQPLFADVSGRPDQMREERYRG